MVINTTNVGFNTNTPEISDELARKINKMNKAMSKYAIPRSGFGTGKSGYQMTEDEKIAWDCIIEDKEIPKDVAKRLLDTKKERLTERHKDDDNRKIPLYVLKKAFPQLFKDLC